MNNFDINKINLLIKEQIKNYNYKFNILEVGYVINNGDGIVQASGLNNVMLGEIVKFKKNNFYGMIQSLNQYFVSIIVFGDFTKICEGDQIIRTNKIMEVPVGNNLLGRIINPLGFSIDGLGSIKNEKMRPLENSAPGIMKRKSVNRSFQTGIKVIDSLTPIGCGQRELIIGDRKTGKTSIVLDMIINQKNKNIICIYVAIGQKASTVVKQIDILKKFDALKYTIVIVADPSQLPSLLYISPYTGTAIAEEFMYNNKDVLIIYDDLSKHAVAYRELSLLLKKSPGREAYPGDIFYLHSRLLERSAQLNDSMGGGSITAIPIVETQNGDISSYIPTNIISITDGQIFLDNELFYSGFKPAVDARLSVSRVGSAAQIDSMKYVSANLRLDLANYYELKIFTQFGSDLEENTKLKLNRGRKILEIFKQKQFSPLSIEKQVIILYSLINGFLDDILLKYILKFEEKLFNYIENNYLELINEMLISKKMPKKIKLFNVIKEFKKKFQNNILL